MNGNGQQITPSAAFANWQQGGNGNPSTPIPQQIGAMKSKRHGKWSILMRRLIRNCRRPHRVLVADTAFVPPMNQPTTNPAPMPAVALFLRADLPCVLPSMAGGPGRCRRNSPACYRRPGASASRRTEQRHTSTAAGQCRTGNNWEASCPAVTSLGLVSAT